MSETPETPEAQPIVPTAATDQATGPAEPVDAVVASVPAAARSRAPRKRALKLDAVLAEAVGPARDGLEGLARDEQVGEHLGVTAEDERLATHRFAALLPGYRGWQWYSTLARAPRSKHMTVCEVGLLPGEEAIVAPDWVPWADRVSGEDKARMQAIAAGVDPSLAVVPEAADAAVTADESVTSDANAPTAQDEPGEATAAADQPAESEQSETVAVGEDAQA